MTNISKTQGLAIRRVNWGGRFSPLIIFLFTQIASVITAQAQNCSFDTNDSAQLKCEVTTHAGRPGKRLPADRFFFNLGEEETLEPKDYCYEQISYKRTICFSGPNGIQTCALLVTDEINCGAGGESYFVYKCSRWERGGRMLCTRNDVRLEGADTADPDKIRREMGTAAVANPSLIEPQYRAQLGSFRKEIEAYLNGRSVSGRIAQMFPDWWKDLHFSVTEAQVAGQRWFRLSMTEPRPRQEVVSLCEKYSLAINGDCQPMPTTLVRK